jgi:hypothetical protein
MPASFQLPPGGLVLCTYRYTISGQSCINTFWYENDSLEPRQVVSLDLAADFDEKVVSVIQDVQSEDVTQGVITVQRITPTRLTVSQHLPAQTVGVVASPTTPQTTAIVVKRTTDQAGRKFRGRFFIAGIAQSSYVGGSLTEAFDTSPAMADVRGLSLVALAAVEGTIAPVIVGYDAGVPVSRGLITGSTSDRILRVQRRRETGVGQ